MIGGERSLRFRLLAWAIVPGILLSAAIMYEAYISARETADSLHDRFIVGLALGISEQVVATGGDLVAESALDVMTAGTADEIFYKVTGPDSAFLTGYYDLPEVPEDRTLEGGIPLFYDATYRDEPVRVVAMSFLVAERDINGWVTVQVSQTRHGRQQVITESVVRAGARLVLLIGVALFFAWIGITQGLAPLKRLQEAIRRRSYEDLRPITHPMPQEIRDVVAAINQLLARLKVSIASQEQFIANASHQLRTPLAALQAQSEVALREADSEESKESLGKILSATQHSSRLANQLLNLARAQHDSSEPKHEERFDVAELAAELTGEWVPEALAKHFDLGFEGPTRGLWVKGNPTLLREMLANLIDNALRYCPGGTCISVRTRATGGAGEVVLEVEDDGPGIPKDKRVAVFDRFVRLSEQAEGGCGLGLAIVQEIAERHGGEVALHTAPSGGLLVRIVLPGAFAESAACADDSSPMVR